MIRRCINKLRLVSSQRALQVVCGALVLIFVVISATHTAHAMSLLNFNLAQLIADTLANMFYTLQTIASWLIYLAGSLLNLSINLTMHIKEFTAATPAIYTVWKAIRDIAGMFIIFSLLYAAIMLITSYNKPNFGTLIKNIVVAGVLINFSFFITGLAIDVSNIVSLQLYNAIAPQQTLDGSLDLKKFINLSNADGGLSTIFMQSLGITRLFNPDGGASTAAQKSDGSWTEPIKVVLIGVTSIIIMITAAISFFIAALTFLVRFIILLFLLAFSPILFASFVVPEIGKYADMWKKTLKGQLIFMPVYLLLMYFALSVLTSSSIFKDGYAGHLTPSGNFMQDLMVLGVNAAIVIVMLNVPLLAALSVGAIAPKWAEKVGADAIWKKVGSKTGRFAGRNTLGWAANMANESALARRIYASNPNLGMAVSKGLSKVSSAGFGDKKGSYDAVLKQRKKDVEALHKHIGKDDANEERGRRYQETMRGKLNERSVLTFMMRDRANIESSKALSKKAEKESKKRAKSDAEKGKAKARSETKENNDGMEKQIAELETDIASLEQQKGGPMSPQYHENTDKIEKRRTAISLLRNKINENNAKLREVNEQFDEDIRVGKEVEESEKNDRMIEALEKSKEGGGGGDKKEGGDKK